MSDAMDVSAVPSNVRRVAADVSLERSTLEDVARLDVRGTVFVDLVLLELMLLFLLGFFALALFLFLFLFLFLAMALLSRLSSSMQRGKCSCYAVAR
jgi:hypothetical protein